MVSSQPVFYNVNGWIAENEKDFLPPVCNKMMHKAGQMKLFFVGGPNVRKDYHIDVGEELFYMLKGDMCLPILEKGKHRDVHIKEGEIFLLPGCIPHSPQRQANTVGIVMERERADNELDGLRYYVEKNGQTTTETLYEAWFHCTDLGTQLAPIIEQFFSSQQYKTGKPIPGTITENPPVKIDTERTVSPPFLLKTWIDKHRAEIDSKGYKRIYAESHQFQVFMYGNGETSDVSDNAETFLWQWEGESVVSTCGKEWILKANDSLLVPVGERFSVKQTIGSLTLVSYQDSRKAPKLVTI